MGCLAEGAPHSACQIILLVEISFSESGQLPKANELDFSLFLLCAYPSPALELHLIEIRLVVINRVILEEIIFSLDIANLWPGWPKIIGLSPSYESFSVKSGQKLTE